MIFTFNTEVILNFQKEHKLSVEQFCKECGIKISEYKRIITNAPNIGNLSSLVILKLSRYLKAKPSDLLIIN